jgi:D-2-hydroxyacid dehydrogenase (NADP+)
VSNFLNVVYTRPKPNFGLLEPQFVDMIQAVDPRIKFQDIAELVDAESKGDIASKKKLDTILSQTNVLFGFPPPDNLLSRAPELKWVQTPLAGVDVFLYPEFVSSPVLLTNGKGIGIRVAETALLFTLMFAKFIPLFDRYRSEKHWKKEIPLLLENKTMGILGLGVIGSEIARLAKAFHMKVIATEIRRRNKSDAGIVDVFLPAERLPELLAGSDFVVSALPLNRFTAKTIGEAQLKMMKPTAYLINISRGAIVDEEILVRALKENWIAGAGLDVFETEPLPPSSPLWDLPNVIMTPHIAGQRDDYDLQATRLFCRNLKRILSGKQLINLIDKERGF